MIYKFKFHLKSARDQICLTSGQIDLQFLIDSQLEWMYLIYTVDDTASYKVSVNNFKNVKP